MSTEESNGQRKETQNNVPEWLKPELFGAILKENVEGFEKIKTFKAYPAMGAGENYATIMLRIEIEVEVANEKTKSVSYMLKIGHDNEFYNDFVKKHNIFDIEQGMYTVIVPEMEQILRDVGLDVNFSAKCYELPIDKLNVLLEDLRPRGFKNANRLEGLDMEHTKNVLRKLALWHAVSAYRVETKGKYPDLYSYGFFTETQFETLKQVNDSMSKCLLQCAKNFNGSEAYFEDLKRMSTNLFDRLIKVAKYDPNEFNVLNHGDFWANNIMFQYDAFGKIKETYFVDYQIPKYGTPAQDLFYFLLSSTKFDIKLKQFEFFIKFYHDHLFETLTLLKYPKKLPTLRDIHSALYKYGVWGVSTVTGVMAAVLLDPTEGASFENFIADSTEGNDFKLLMFSNPRYRKHAEAILPWLQNRGALEL